ncbi:MAG: hypothetical protein GXP33_08585 [Spirochaetes bacterium]|nr:hypothetical protein [Spirochaetota bacterium]
MKFIIIYICALLVFFSAVFSVDAGDLELGFSLQSQAGLSPLLVINENSVGFRLKYRISELLSLNSTTSIGHSYLYIAYQSRNWFHFSEEISAGFPLLLGKLKRASHYLSIAPGIYISYSPFSYFLYGPGLNITYSIRNFQYHIIIEPLSIFIRPLLRDTSLSFKWHFQAGIRFSLLWMVSK